VVRCTGRGWDLELFCPVAGVPTERLPHVRASLFPAGVPSEDAPDGGASANPVLPIFAPLPEDLCLVLSSVYRAETSVSTV